jgi:hypothetical protein
MERNCLGHYFTNPSLTGRLWCIGQIATVGIWLKSNNRYLFGQDSGNYWSFEDTTTVFSATTWVDIDIRLDSPTSSLVNPGLIRDSIYLKLISSTSNLDNIRLVKSDATVISRSQLSTPSSHTTTETKIVTFTLQVTPAEELT